jgi:hypothetical protein
MKRIQYVCGALLLVALFEGIITLGSAFNPEIYNIFGIVFQVLLITYVTVMAVIEADKSQSKN